MYGNLRKFKHIRTIDTFESKSLFEIVPDKNKVKTIKFKLKFLSFIYNL